MITHGEGEEMSDREYRPDSAWIIPVQPGARSSARRHPAAAKVSLGREGGLSPGDAAAVRAHLEVCARCRRLEAKLAQIHGILGYQDQALTAEAKVGSSGWPPVPRAPSLYS